MTYKRLGFLTSLRIIGKALVISFRTRGTVSLCISVLGFGIAFVPMLTSQVLRTFTDQVQALYGKGTGQIGSVLSVFSTLAGLYIIQTLFTFSRDYYAKVDTMNVQKYIKEHLLRCSCNVKYKYIENYDDYKERIAFVDTFAGYRVANSMQAIVGWLQSFITFVSLIVVLLTVNPFIVFLLIVTCVPAIVLAYKQKDEDYRHRTKWMKEGNFVIRYFHDCCGQPTLNEVRFLGLFSYLKNKWKTMAKTYIGIKNNLTRRHVLYNSIADILRNSVYILVLLIVAGEIFKNPALGLGVFMLVFTMAGQLQEVTTRLFVGAAQFAGDIGYMSDFFDLDNLEYEMRDNQAKPYESADIAFENVDFTYPNTAHKVLQGVTVRIKQGEKIAIVGENGSGKTTFVNLLCAMHEPDSGTIYISDENISHHVSRVRRTISAVFQDFGKYETSLRDNITVSDSNKEATSEQLKALAEETGAYDFIKSQPHGFDEIVGSFNEEGNNLSGGQWQKIAITRAAYRDRARIMILDEPTAALDPIAEANLYRNFAQLTGDRTTILISHRLGITRIVDRVLVFDDGKIVEDGSHTELMAQDGLYARMYNAQAQWYGEAHPVQSAERLVI